MAKKQSRRQRRAAAQAQAKRRQLIRVGGLIVLGLVTLAGLFFWQRSGATGDTAVATPPNLIGSEDAPVHIVEFGDFGCHACRAWHNSGVKEQLLATYGDQIAFEFRHFPVITAQSPQAAEAGQCAAEQGAFWQYHDLYIRKYAGSGAERVCSGSLCRGHWAGYGRF